MENLLHPDTLKEILNLLTNTETPVSEIAKKTGVSMLQIRSISREIGAKKGKKIVTKKKKRSK